MMFFSQDFATKCGGFISGMAFFVGLTKLSGTQDDPVERLLIWILSTGVAHAYVRHAKNGINPPQKEMEKLSMYLLAGYLATHAYLARENNEPRPRLL